MESQPNPMRAFSLLNQFITDLKAPPSQHIRCPAVNKWDLISGSDNELGVCASQTFKQYMLSIYVCVVCFWAETTVRPYLWQTFFKKEVILLPDLIRTVSPCATAEEFVLRVTVNFLSQSVNICIVLSEVTCQHLNKPVWKWWWLMISVWQPYCVLWEHRF